MKTFDGLRKMCAQAIDSGIVTFDTAPSYKTEEVLGCALAEVIKEKEIVREQIRVQTKIDPIQMYEGLVEDYFRKKLTAMGLEYVDALLVHWPVYKYFRKTWEEMTAIKEKGLARRIGICNLRVEHLRELESIGIVPEILQIERHPLNTFEQECLFCRQHQIEVQSYSPLCKMHPLLRENPMLKRIAESHGANIGQVIMKWHIQTGAIPVFTTTKSERIVQYAALGDIVLTEDEISAVSSLNCNHKMYLESLICPGS